MKKSFFRKFYYLYGKQTVKHQCIGVKNGTKAVLIGNADNSVFTLTSKTNGN